MNKQETLEEAAYKDYINNVSKPYCQTFSQDTIEEAFIRGTKWQSERMYSEEDMKKAFEDGKEDIDYCKVCGFISKLTTEEWFEQFSKLKNS